MAYKMIALIFDTETTGLISNHSIMLDKQPSVIEYYGAMVNLKTRKVISDLERLIKPSEYPMTDWTIKETKTRLSNELLADAKLFEHHAKDIQRQIENASVIIAHNLSFDMEMVGLEFERLGINVDWPVRRFCTVEQTTHLKGMRLSLTNLHLHLFNKAFSEAHRAKPDTEALIRCCCELYKRDML